MLVRVRSEPKVPSATPGSLTENTSRGDYLKSVFISPGKEGDSGFSPVGMLKPPSSCLPLTCWLLVRYSDYGTPRFTSHLFWGEFSYPQVQSFGDNLVTTNQVMSRWGPCRHLLPGATKDHCQTWTGLGVTCSLGWGRYRGGEQQRSCGWPWGCGLGSRVWGRLGVRPHGARVEENHWVPAPGLGAAQQAGQCPQRARPHPAAANEVSQAGLVMVAMFSQGS